jgi:hypothetical protein
VENGAKERRELERAAAVDCRACRVLCEQTLELLIGGAGAGEDGALVRTLTSCAAVTETTAAWLEGERMPPTALLEYCAEVCEAALEVLEAAPRVQRVRECVEACRAGADAVRALLWAGYETDG